MGDFSRNTFDIDVFNRLKHYVSVRLQQGVPIIDSDWNELADFQAFEQRTFLKWFVGDGVPKGNNGFCILPVYKQVILEYDQMDDEPPKRTFLMIDLQSSTAHEILGFGPGNASAERLGPPASGFFDTDLGPATAQLTGTQQGPFKNLSGKKLVIKVDSTESDPLTVIFSTEKTAEEVRDRIIDVAQENDVKVTASVGQANDFDIGGGNGTTYGVGLCLVNGMEVVNECNLTFSRQGLSLPYLEAGATRKDIAYLEVWEREINSEEDPEIQDDRIGIESSVRTKREWVVKVIEEENWPPMFTPMGQDIYRLAAIERKGDEPINAWNISDLRTKDLSLAALATEFSAHDHSGRSKGVMIGLNGLKPIVRDKFVDLSRIYKVPLLKQTVFSERAIVNIGMGRNAMPLAIAFDGIYIWVVNSGRDNVRKIDPVANSVGDPIPAGKDPQRIAFDGTYMWVTNNNSDENLYQIDINADQTVNAFRVGDAPKGLAFDGTYLWVANSGSNNYVQKIDVSSGTKETIDLPISPEEVAYDGTYVWVIGQVGACRILDDWVEHYSHLGLCSGIAFDGSSIWVAKNVSEGGEVLKVNIHTGDIKDHITARSELSGVAFDGTHIWVTNEFDSSVSVIDISSTTEVAFIKTGVRPEGIAFDGTYIWVANKSDNNVSKIKKIF